jgi:hypothetical protein
MAAALDDDDAFERELQANVLRSIERSSRRTRTSMMAGIVAVDEQKDLIKEYRDGNREELRRKAIERREAIEAGRARPRHVDRHLPEGVHVNQTEVIFSRKQFYGNMLFHTLNSIEKDENQRSSTESTESSK